MEKVVTEEVFFFLLKKINSAKIIYYSFVMDRLFYSFAIRFVRSFYVKPIGHKLLVLSNEVRLWK
ncbi:hypothetical protein M2137_002747 [Parabacteroides sp. PFB2-10]|nr:hypothetical protein [Parabacteroides sp. PFB2-10]